MIQVKAVASFDHHGMRHPGDTFSVSDQHAEGLEKAKLVERVGAKSQCGGGTSAAGAKLVDKNAPEAIAAIEKTTDAAVLSAALEAEQAGKDRKTVLDALHAALAAAEGEDA